MVQESFEFVVYMIHACANELLRFYKSVKMYYRFHCVA